MDVSTIGTRNMLELAKQKNVEGFLFTSSSEVYGDPPDQYIPTPETYNGNVSISGPRACYDESKRVGETLCYINSNFFDKKTAIIRPFNVYGPGMSMNDYRIIPNITRSLVFNEELKIYDTGTQTRTYCYVSDAINGFLKVIIKDEKFGIYNIGTNEEITIAELAMMIGHHFGRLVEIIPSDLAEGGTSRRCPDLTKLIALGYQPRFSLRQGLRLVASWYDQHADQHLRLLNGREDGIK